MLQCRRTPLPFIPPHAFYSSLLLLSCSSKSLDSFFLSLQRSISSIKSLLLYRKKTFHGTEQREREMYRQGEEQIEAHLSRSPGGREGNRREGERLKTIYLQEASFSPHALSDIRLSQRCQKERRESADCCYASFGDRLSRE